MTKGEARSRPLTTSRAGAFKMIVFRPVFEFRQEQEPSFQVDILPPQMKNFAEASAG